MSGMEHPTSSKNVWTGALVDAPVVLYFLSFFINNHERRSRLGCGKRLSFAVTSATAAMTAICKKLLRSFDCSSQHIRKNKRLVVSVCFFLVPSPSTLVLFGFILPHERNVHMDTNHPAFSIEKSIEGNVHTRTAAWAKKNPRRLDEDDVDSTRRLISTTPPPSRHPLQTLALVIASTTTTMTTTTTTTATAMSTLLMSTAVMSIATAAATAAARRKATTAAKQLTAQKPKRLANAAKLAWNKFRMDPKVQNVPDLRQYMDGVQMHVDALED